MKLYGLFKENTPGEDTPALLDQGASGSSSVSVHVPSDYGNNEIEKAVLALAQKDERVYSIIENRDKCSELILKLLTSNEDAREFALGYPEHAGESTVGKVTTEELSAGIPYFLQWDNRWGYVYYGSEVLGLTGCGPTSLSMIVTGLTGRSDTSPADVAAMSYDSGYYVEGAGSSWELMTTGAEQYGLVSKEIPLVEGCMASELSAGRPIIINVGPGDFTDAGHFMVITDYNDGLFTILDPNSPTNSSQDWSYDTLAPQIMNIWSFQAA